MRQHSIRAHLIAPVWLRLPAKWRWSVVHRLDRSRRQCWSTLVDAALASPEADSCDVRIPSLRGERTPRCASVCDWSHPEHTGRHSCDCYCGKFRFTAADGYADRGGASSSN